MIWENEITTNAEKQNIFYFGDREENIPKEAFLNTNSRCCVKGSCPQSENIKLANLLGLNIFTNLKGDVYLRHRDISYRIFLPLA